MNAAAMATSWRESIGSDAPERSTCPFCQADPERVVLANDIALAMSDGFPVNPGHTLIVPRRHVPNWFDATRGEQRALLDLVDQVKERLDRSLRPAGYNIGINVGEAAGQTVMHLHLHVIPRFPGDVDDPTGGVRCVIPERGNYRRPGRVPRVPRAPRAPALATGGRADPFRDHLVPELSRATQVDVLSAFVQHSGVRLLAPGLHSAMLRGAGVRVLTGDYLDITQESGLRCLLDLARASEALATEPPDGTPGRDGDLPAPAQDLGMPSPGGGPVGVGALELRVVETGTLLRERVGTTFHPKAWILSRADHGVAFVGSSNLSQAALVDGVEWNLRLEEERDPEAFRQVRDAYERCWGRARPVDESWLDQYARRARQQARPVPLPLGEMEPEPLAPPPDPHRIQQEALGALAASRAEGRQRALVVLATGLGKTWLAAFDIRRMELDGGRFPRTLFLAHRVELLQQAAVTLRRLFPDRAFTWFAGRQDRLDGEVVFASVAKLALPKNLVRVPPDAFEYVVVDEVHHAHAVSYRRILDHLRPRFCLGLTATPERADEGDVLGLFDDHLPYRADLGAGIQAGLLVPFAYYGLKDEVDYRPENIPWRNRRFDPSALERAIQTERRMEQLWTAWQERPGTRTLVFCCSVRHACFVRDWLRRHGVRVTAVFAGPDSDDRAEALIGLEAGRLDAVCAVDLFNEGVDVPHIDRVVMLRPTESPVVFVQQLGRGLRRAEQKARLTVIDFVGNHRVFLLRVRTLLKFGGSPTALADFLREPERDAELPAGCSIAIELEAIALLEKLLPRGKAEVERAFRELLAIRGERPTAGDLFREGFLPRALRAGDGGWFDFLEAERCLTEAEARVLREGRTWFRDLETTGMTRCFKMIVIEALLERDALVSGLTLDDLALRSHDILARRPELFRDIVGVDELPDPERPERRAWRAYWEKNPVHAWTNPKESRRRWFALEGDRFVPNLPVPPGDEATFESMTRELVDYRLAQYRARPRVGGRDGEGGPTSFECKVTWNRRDPVLKLPSRRVLPDLPLGEVDVRLPDGAGWRFRLQREFCKVARPVGADRNGLPDLLRRWFGPVAGKPGTGFHVRFHRSAEGWRIEPVGAKVLEFPPRGRVVAYPSLRAAAGALADPLADAPEPELVALPGVDPADDRFAVRATGDSMDGGAAPIRDGDWVVLRRARDLGLGALVGRVALVQSPDPVDGFSFQLKRVVRATAETAGTGWLLRSDNPDRPSYPAGAESVPVAVVDRVIRPEALAPAEGTMLADHELAEAFHLSEPPGTGRFDGHLFLALEDGAALAAPDRVRRAAGDRRPGETAFVLLRVPPDGRWRYCGVGRWIEREGAWAIPALDARTWHLVRSAP